MPARAASDEPRHWEGGTIALGDRVVFARLDLAEALGIWRKATGRIVEIHAMPNETVTVDIQFDGHETLREYLLDPFTRVH